MRSFLPRFLAALATSMVVSCAPTPKFPSYAPPNPSPAFQTPAYSDPYAAVPAPSIFRPNSAAPNIRAASYILIDANTGRTLAARNADAARGVASTQKLVTALVVSKSGNLDRSLRVESSDTRVEPTKIGLVPGETLSRKSVLYAFLVKSGNDGANALARDNAGSIPAFAARMNGMARHCGASNSHFVNPHGLSAPGQYSTARDMAKIAMMAYRDPVIRDVVKQRYVSFHGHSLKNTNDLLNRMPECNGMKTGYTNAAGKCLVSSASRYGKAVILVQLGSHLKYIWDDGQAMMNWGLANL